MTDQSALNYLLEKSYRRGLKTSVSLSVCAVVVCSYLSFMAGQTYEYSRAIDEFNIAVEKTSKSIDAPNMKGMKK